MLFSSMMLTVIAQWMGVNDTHANNMAPLLITSVQGIQKSTFCKSFLTDPLHFNSTYQLYLAASGIENKFVCAQAVSGVEHLHTHTGNRYRVE